MSKKSRNEALPTLFLPSLQQGRTKRAEWTWSCHTTLLLSYGKEKQAHRKVSALGGLRKRVNTTEEPNLMSESQAPAEAACGAPGQASPGPLTRHPVAGQPA